MRTQSYAYYDDQEHAIKWARRENADLRGTIDDMDVAIGDLMHDKASLIREIATLKTKLAAKPVPTPWKDAFDSVVVGTTLGFGAVALYLTVAYMLFATNCH